MAWVILLLFSQPRELFAALGPGLCPQRPGARSCVASSDCLPLGSPGFIRMKSQAGMVLDPSNSREAVLRETELVEIPLEVFPLAQND